MLAICFGGITVALKTWSRPLCASQTQTSFSSGVRPTPWLGQPCRLVGPCLKPATSTRCSFLPVVKSPISKPSRPLTVTKVNVWLPFTVNGLIGALNGPTAPTTLRVFTSKTVKSGERSPAM